MAQIKIVSDGTFHGSLVTVDGKPLGGVTKVEWELTNGLYATAKLTVDQVELEAGVLAGEGAVVSA